MNNDMTNKYLNEGVAFCSKGDFDKAIEIFNKGLKEHPKDTGLLYNLSKAYARIDEFDQALKCLNLILGNDSLNAKVLSERAVVFYHLGIQDKAMADLNKAADIEPENPFRYSSRAWVKAKSGDLEGGIADYEKAIALDPEDAIALNNKGLLEEQLGYQARSKKSFAKSDKLIGYKTPNPKINSDDNKTVEEPVSLEPKMSPSYFFNTIKDLFTSKNVRKEFVNFLRKK